MDDTLDHTQSQIFSILIKSPGLMEELRDRAIIEASKSVRQSLKQRGYDLTVPQAIMITKAILVKD